MKWISLFIFFMIISTIACVDRITIDVGSSSGFPVVVDGFISDQPGPYIIKLTRGFDIQSIYAQRTPISAKRLILSDDQGNRETLSQTGQGIYQTKANGIRGIVGRVYQLHIELLDGRIYESIPDTLLPAGKVDRVYHEYTFEHTDSTAHFGFDVFADGSTGSRKNYHFLWKFTGTYQVDTNPELYDTLCVEARCPKPLNCSGYIVDSLGVLLKKRPCECCTCWISFFNTSPIVSDHEFLETNQLKKVKAAFVPITKWTFMYKVHAEVKQLSLSQQAFDFWRAVKAQHSAINSLFQPITGKVPGNFVQLSGVDAPISGLFYATAISSNSIFILPEDIPAKNGVPPQDLLFKNSCKELFPNASTVKPDYWVD